MATAKQITLVRNLLALTQSSFPAEAEEAERKAKELILKWGITEADVLPPRPEPRSWQSRCPGCPNCRPKPRPRTTGIVVDEMPGVGRFQDGDRIYFSVGASPGSTTTFHVWWEEA